MRVQDLEEIVSYSENIHIEDQHGVVLFRGDFEDVVKKYGPYKILILQGYKPRALFIRIKIN